MSRRSFLRGIAAVGLLTRSLAAADPVLPDPLRRMKETFERPLPSRFKAKSRLNWSAGVVTGQYEYHGSPQRCVIRSSLHSIGRLQGEPFTVHARRLVLYGGTWIDGGLGVDPELGDGHDALVIETFRSQHEDKASSSAEPTLRASRPATFEPRASLAGIGIAFGFRHQAAHPELWASDPAETTILRPEQEQIDGIETVVVELASPAQRRTLWLDPQKGMLPRQIEIGLRGPDVQPVGAAHRFAQSFWDDLPPGRRAFYHSFRIEEIAGEPWITGFRAEFESDDQDGKPCLLKGEYAIENVRMNAPPPTEEELATAAAVPEEARVEVLLPEQERGRFGLWKEGRVRQGGVGFF